jgi:hypothetical protein
MPSELKQAAVAVACAAMLAPAWATKGLNDTGSVLCRAIDGSFSSECAGTGQDGEFGRDVRLNDSSDGKAGFSFVKISVTGAELPATGDRVELRA